MFGVRAQVRQESRRRARSVIVPDPKNWTDKCWDSASNYTSKLVFYNRTTVALGLLPRGKCHLINIMIILAMYVGACYVQAFH